MTKKILYFVLYFLGARAIAPFLPTGENAINEYMSESVSGCVNDILIGWLVRYVELGVDDCDSLFFFFFGLFSQFTTKSFLNIQKGL